MQAALERVVAAGGFVAHVNGQVFGPGTPVTAGVIDVVFPDRIHARTEMIDFISMPDGAWINLFGIWTPVDRDQIPITSFAKPRDAQGDRVDRRCARGRLGHDQRAASRISTASARRVSCPGAEANGDARIWICAKDGRPARLEAIDAGSGAKLDVVFDWSRRAHVESPDD